MCFAKDFSFPIKYQEKVKLKMNYPSNDDSQFFFIECLSTERFSTIKENSNNIE